jgi:hypothetical protein
MSSASKTPQVDALRRTNAVLLAVCLGFFALAAALLSNFWGQSEPVAQIPPVNPSFLDTTAWRKSYSDLVREKADLSDFDCYTCHDKKNPPPLRFDKNQVLVVPEEHAEVKMGHGSHNRNNLCYNCHNEGNLLTFSTRSGTAIKFADSPQLCGSCHGPNLRDWEAGVHGRMNGYWNRKLGEARRLDCVNCHNPHAPRIPTRPPAPAPHSLHQAPAAPAPSEATH